MPAVLGRVLAWTADTMSVSATAQPQQSSGGVDMKTLLITAVASAVAAYTCSKLWTPGTLVAAAFTPVLLAILKDVLAKSTDVVVARAAPVRGMVRSAATKTHSAAPTDVHPRASDSRASDPPVAPPVVQSPFDDPLGSPVMQPPFDDFAGEEDDPSARVPQPGEIVYHAGGGRWKAVRVAVVTGLLGFLLAAAVMTVPELAAGGSASGNGRGTTFFGGGEDRDRDSKKESEQAPAPAPEQQPPVTTPPPDEGTTTAPDALPPTGGDAAPPPEDPDAEVRPSRDAAPRAQPPG
ncbi:MAG: hypothetical protein ACR2LK_16810 [Solirubrobacteraceae bacterium]